MSWLYRRKSGVWVLDRWRQRRAIRSDTGPFLVMFLHVAALPVNTQAYPLADFVCINEGTKFWESMYACRHPRTKLSFRLVWMLTGAASAIGMLNQRNFPCHIAEQTKTVKVAWLHVVDKANWKVPCRLSVELDRPLRLKHRNGSDDSQQIPALCFLAPTS